MAIRSGTRRRSNKNVFRYNRLFYGSVGAVVRARREVLGINGEDFGKKLGLSQAQVSRLECGKQGLRLGVLRRIGKILGALPSKLLAEAEKPLLVEHPKVLLPKADKKVAQAGT